MHLAGPEWHRFLMSVTVTPLRVGVYESDRTAKSEPAFGSHGSVRPDQAPSHQRVCDHREVEQEQIRQGCEEDAACRLIRTLPDQPHAHPQEPGAEDQRGDAVADPEQAFENWTSSLWSENDNDPRRLLTSAQAQALWKQVIDESAEAERLINSYRASRWHARATGYSHI